MFRLQLGSEYWPWGSHSGFSFLNTFVLNMLSVIESVYGVEREKTAEKSPHYIACESLDQAAAVEQWMCRAVLATLRRFKVM